MEYYEIVNEARPLSPQMLICHSYRNRFLIMKLIKQSSKFQSDPGSNFFTMLHNHLKNKLLQATVYFRTFVLLFVSHFTQLLECFDM